MDVNTTLSPPGTFGRYHRTLRRRPRYPIFKSYIFCKRRGRVPILGYKVSHHFIFKITGVSWVVWDSESPKEWPRTECTILSSQHLKSTTRNRNGIERDVWLREEGGFGVHAGQFNSPPPYGMEHLCRSSAISKFQKDWRNRTAPYHRRTSVGPGH